MAKRELSSTLRNLKFMNRALLREGKKEAKKEVENKADETFFGSSTQTGKCIVVMEGNPHPGAVKGRMSFLSFNPSIDKLNEEAANLSQPQVSTTNSTDEKCLDGDGESSQMKSEDSFISGTNSNSNGDHKRKQPENASDAQHSKKSPRNASEEASPNNRNGSYKKQQGEKLDWNLLRPQKHQNRS